MRYEVRIVGAYDLPKRQDWALVELGNRTVLIVKEGALTTALIAEVWAAERRLRRHEPVQPLGRQLMRAAQ